MCTLYIVGGDLNPVDQLYAEEMRLRLVELLECEVVRGSDFEYLSRGEEVEIWDALGSGYFEGGRPLHARLEEKRLRSANARSI
jgi:hypothetical protein